MVMTTGLKKFLENIFDYAGLFPPAELSMDEAVHNFARYRQEDDNWILSRFVCPASRLHELEPYGNTLLQEGDPFIFSILGRPSLDIEEFGRNLKEDLQHIADFNHQHGNYVLTDMMELKFPHMSVSPEDHLNALDGAGKLFDESSPSPMDVYFEVDQGDKWFHKVSEAIPAIAEFNVRKSVRMLKKAGFKLRSGGVRADMFPSVEEVAHVIRLCREENVPFKATAGLHHPVRYFDEVYQVWAHGFFNVFLAGILAHSHNLPDIIILSILEEDDPESFFFNEDYIGWKDVRISVGQLQSIRQEKMISIGSCSFDEPREDLISLKLF